MTVRAGLQTFEFQERFELPRPLTFATHEDAIDLLKRLAREHEDLTRRFREYLSRYSEGCEVARLTDHQTIERLAVLLRSHRIVVIARENRAGGTPQPRIKEVAPPFPLSERKAREALAKARTASVSRGTPVLASLWVRINLPQQQAAKETGSLRLFGSGYDSTIAIAGNFVVNPDPAGTVDVHFENVPTTGSYSLIYIAGDRTKTRIVESAPFHTLKDESLSSAAQEN